MDRALAAAIRSNLALFLLAIAGSILSLRGLGGETKFLPEGAAPGAAFGSAMAMRDGWLVVLPGNTAVVAGHRKLRIYGHDGVRWQLRQQILNRGGSALALQGDVLLSSAPGDGQAGNAAGAVYQFLRTATGWVEAAKLLPPGKATGARFGTSVALWGDALVAGAPFHSQGPGEVQSAGAAFLFRWHEGAWGVEAVLFASDAPNPLALNFARSVALGPDTLWAGAPQDDEAGLNTGAVYRFTPPWPTYPDSDNGSGPPPQAGGPPPHAGRGRLSQADSRP